LREEYIMSTVSGGVRLEAGGSLSFGDYRAEDKIKVNDWEAAGNLYNIRTHKAVTRVEKNGKLLIEAVPGAAFLNFAEKAEGAEFRAEGAAAVQITLELEPETDYALFINGADEGVSRTNLSGKLTFGADLSCGPQEVVITRK
jgi:hypothetical protein